MIEIDEVKFDDRLISDFTVNKRANTITINLFGTEKDEEIFKKWGKMRFRSNTKIQSIKIGNLEFSNYIVIGHAGVCNYINDTATLTLTFQKYNS